MKVTVKPSTEEKLLKYCNLMNMEPRQFFAYLIENLEMTSPPKILFQFPQFTVIEKIEGKVAKRDNP